MPAFPYEIAFSFAGSRRGVVEQVATCVQRAMPPGVVFYDRWFEHRVHGPSMDLELHRIYGNETRMIVVCLSKDYPDRSWCRTEWDAIRALGRTLDTSRDRVARLRLAYLRFDNAEIPGVLDNDHPFFVSGKSVEEIASYLRLRHAELTGASRGGSWVARVISGARDVVIGPAAPAQPAGPSESPGAAPVRVESPLGPAPSSPPRSLQSKHGPAGIELLAVPGGTFLMGSPERERDRGSDERQHSVTLSPFYLAATPITQAQWATVMKDRPAPSTQRGDDLPVETVSWHDAAEFCERLGALDGRRYRLPTESEWEYACRGGGAITTAYVWGGDLVRGRGWANLYDKSAQRNGEYGWAPVPWDDQYPTTSPVRQFQPNPWGIFDLIGNVWEWCSDRYGPYPAGSVTDPAGPSEGEERVLRGSSWYDAPTKARVSCRHKAARSFRFRHIGFRIAASAM